MVAGKLITWPDSMPGKQKLLLLTCLLLPCTRLNSLPRQKNNYFCYGSCLSCPPPPFPVDVYWTNLCLYFSEETNVMNNSILLFYMLSSRSITVYHNAENVLYVFLCEGRALVGVLSAMEMFSKCYLWCNKTSF